MNYILRFCLCLASIFVLGSCAEAGEETSYNENETKALSEWMKENRPLLLNNLQEEGGYYVEVETLAKDNDTNDETNPPISDTAVWVRLEFSGRDLAGNLAVTRNDIEANQQDEFTKYTRYVPTYQYVSTTNVNTLGEGTILAMTKELVLSQEYADANGFKEKTIKMRLGTKVTLYLPSSVVGYGGGFNADGGYEGQFALDAGRPFIVTMEVMAVVKNPLEREGTDVDAFAKANGDLRIPPETEEETRADEEDVIGPDHPYKDEEDWRNVVDSIPQLYVNLRFNPEISFLYDKVPDVTQYESAYAPYTKGNFAKIQADIVAALKERFDLEKNPYVGVTELKTDSVTIDGAAKIWYIGRFLDGFIFDTNIDEVKEIIYGEVAVKGTAMDYSKDAGLISAWQTTIPTLRYGQWAAILTTSPWAYGLALDMQGSSSTTGSSSGYDPYAYLSMYNYGNSYGGGYGYGNMGYGNMGYGNMGYGNMGYGSSSTTTTETTTTIRTEIPAYTPLIFEIYIEPKE